MWPGNSFQARFTFQKILHKMESEEVHVLILLVLLVHI